MKNFQKIALGLMIVGLAFGFSAFTNAKKVAPAKAKGVLAITSSYLVQRGVDEWSQLDPSSASTTPDYLSCFTSTTRRCTYIVTAAGKANIPLQATYNATEIASYLAATPNPYLTLDPNSSTSLYND